MDELTHKAEMARQASYSLSQTGDPVRSKALESMAKALINHEREIIEANMRDMEEYQKKFPASPLLDRLVLNENRIRAASEGK
jgi:glutamate-5-semialdehyde dehydrogenase